MHFTDESDKEEQGQEIENQNLCVVCLNVRQAALLFLRMAEVSSLEFSSLEFSSPGKLVYFLVIFTVFLIIKKPRNSLPILLFHNINNVFIMFNSHTILTKVYKIPGTVYKNGLQNLKYYYS